MVKTTNIALFLVLAVLFAISVSAVDFEWKINAEIDSVNWYHNTLNPKSPPLKYCFNYAGIVQPIWEKNFAERVFVISGGHYKLYAYEEHGCNWNKFDYWVKDSLSFPEEVFTKYIAAGSWGHWRIVDEVHEINKFADRVKFRDKQYEKDKDGFLYYCCEHLTRVYFDYLTTSKINQASVTIKEEVKALGNVKKVLGNDPLLLNATNKQYHGFNYPIVIETDNPKILIGFSNEALDLEGQKEDATPIRSLENIDDFGKDIVYVCLDSNEDKHCDFIYANLMCPDGDYFDNTGGVYAKACCGPNMSTEPGTFDSTLNAFCTLDKNGDPVWLPLDYVGEIFEFSDAFIVSNGSNYLVLGQIPSEIADKSVRVSDDSFFSIKQGIFEHEYICSDDEMFECGIDSPFSSFNSYGLGYRLDLPHDINGEDVYFCAESYRTPGEIGFSLPPGGHFDCSAEFCDYIIDENHFIRCDVNKEKCDLDCTINPVTHMTACVAMSTAVFSGAWWEKDLDKNYLASTCYAAGFNHTGNKCCGELGPNENYEDPWGTEPYILNSGRGIGPSDFMTYAIYNSEIEFRPFFDMDITEIKPDVSDCNGDCFYSAKISDEQGNKIAEVNEEKLNCDYEIINFDGVLDNKAILNQDKTYKIQLNVSSTKAISIYTTGSETPKITTDGIFTVIYARGLHNANHFIRGAVAFSFIGYKEGYGEALSDTPGICVDGMHIPDGTILEDIFEIVYKGAKRICSDNNFCSPVLIDVDEDNAAVCTPQGWFKDDEQNLLDLSLKTTAWNLTNKGCCKADECWAEIGCVAHDSSIGVDSEFFYCDQGTWFSGFTKTDWTGSKLGYCTLASQCFVEFDDDEPVCIEDEEYILDNLCENGNWTSRTSKIFEELYAIAVGIGKPFTIYCDEPENVLLDTINLKNSCEENNEPIPCINNICVAKIEDDVLLATSLNVPVDHRKSFLVSLGLSQNICSGTSSSYVKCSNEPVWYKDTTESLVYSPSLTLIFKPSLNILDSKFLALKDYADSVSSESFDYSISFIKPLFNKVFFAKKGQNEIFSLLEINRTETQINYLGIDYQNTNLGSNACNVFKKFHWSNCEDQTIPQHFYVVAYELDVLRGLGRVIPNPLTHYWKDLTVKLRFKVERAPSGRRTR